MRGARLTSLLLLAVAVAAIASACGSSSSSGGGEAGLIQGRLRSLAAGAPSGSRAYWLGPEFQQTPVSFVDPGWGRFAMLTYRTFDDAMDVDVETFAARADAPLGGYRVATRTATGQQVVLVFRSPRHPGAALVRAAKAALQPIPVGVKYLS